MFKGDLEGNLEVDLEGNSGHRRGLAAKLRSGLGLGPFTAQILFFRA